MKKKLPLLKYIFVCFLPFYSFSNMNLVHSDIKQNTIRNDTKQDTIKTDYVQNRAPLLQKPYLELPIGAIRPQGWLKTQLVAMKNGSTGHLDTLYSKVMGKRNPWLIYSMTPN
jgi:hypothetical protein